MPALCLAYYCSAKPVIGVLEARDVYLSAISLANCPWLLPVSNLMELVAIAMRPSIGSLGVSAINGEPHDVRSAKTLVLMTDVGLGSRGSVTSGPRCRVIVTRCGGDSELENALRGMTKAQHYYTVDRWCGNE